MEIYSLKEAKLLDLIVEYYLEKEKKTDLKFDFFYMSKSKKQMDFNKTKVLISSLLDKLDYYIKNEFSFILEISFFSINKPLEEKLECFKSNELTKPFLNGGGFVKLYKKKEVQYKKDKLLIKYHKYSFYLIFVLIAVNSMAILSSFYYLWNTEKALEVLKIFVPNIGG